MKVPAQVTAQALLRLSCECTGCEIPVQLLQPQRLTALHLETMTRQQQLHCRTGQSQPARHCQPDTCDY